MGNKYKHFIQSLVAILLIGSCSNFTNYLSDHHEEDNSEETSMKVLNVHFDPGYKTFSVNVKMPDEYAIYSLTDSSSIKIKYSESEENDQSYDADTQPVLTKINNIRQQELAKKDLNLLVLVDLTLDEDEVEAEQEAVRKMKNWFPNSLHVAFMKDGTVSETMPATNYVIDNYFLQSNSSKLLYRSILNKIDELKGTPSKYFPTVKQDSIWTSLSDSQKALIVFSDGDVYKGNLPIDPKHFELQKEIIQDKDSISNSSVYYINFRSQYDDGESNEAKPILQQLSQNTNGIYLDSFQWSKLLADILETFEIEYADYQFCFTNPDYKTYRGKRNHLHIECYHKDTLLTSACAHYTIGSIYNPIIINGKSITQIILKGMLITLLIIGFVYFIFQFILPYASYLLFKKKYVTRYTNQNMVYNGIQVSQSCYYCKAPFEEGDEIVVKCQHVMHKLCWDENGYKCPEYGRKCKTGSHFYNTENLFDPRNASFYMKWVIMGIVAGITAWIFFISAMYRATGSILTDVLLTIYNLQPNTPEAELALDKYGSHLYYLPFYGLSINFFLTLFISILCERGRQIRYRILMSVAKAGISGILGYLAFLLGCIISIVLDLERNTFFIDWIPWSLSGFIIAFTSTYHTEIKLRKSLVIIAIILGMGSMYIWSYTFYQAMNSREQLLLSFTIYSVGMAACIATAAPRSERFFLRVEGPIKEMDIALYKWMNTSPSYRVSIGKSVNCSLQMSWDLNSNIAPVQAEIFQSHGHIYLTAIEDGVEMGNDTLPIDEKTRLYHGRKFRIGKTTFTYLEKDI